MEIIVGTDNIKRSLKNPVITIGNFDGVHYGHQVLFQQVKDWAREIDGESVVMTFNPHPLEVLFPGKGPACITPHEQKLELIAACGIDVTIVIPFDKEFAKISAHDFVKKILVDKIGVKAVVVGYDYRFGRNRQGDIELLQKMGEEYGFEVKTLSGIRMAETVVSSTAIRQLIKEGEIKEANRLLGHVYEISGTVITGRQRGGRLLGFPTANIKMSCQAPPRPGVYVVKALVDGKIYGGAANLGYNPTFGDTPFTLEVHILDFNQDIYGAPITVRFLERLRDEKCFTDLQELSAQIRADVEKAREILMTLPSTTE
ncbi:MAG: bifunctional riboflavin kinase/FAD synthetase [Deltaproteobacteria bacterium]|uniref:Riboflavin biosynthesis protein n=1 Tax=Desulforhabdus amnigena TaxID=40218 RepID=A0A9W6FUB9_9BACT|nr:bifunctional riboflavin kinase/FAD synthetase [Deltaproteobacteria bacterium]GLI35014.1 riboflavin biosynthesis protein [Desulforhabdus amnigena]